MLGGIFPQSKVSPSEMIRICRIAILALPLLTLFIGCGGRDLAAVEGQVTFDGHPVKGGALVFSPIPAGEEREPGKSATGDIQPDGSYRLSTYRIHDGAVVGRHRVRYIPAVEDRDEQVDSPAPTAMTYANLSLPADFTVEIESGKSNQIAIELVGRATN
jgi:hypothetical protein